MTTETRIVGQGPRERTVRAENGDILIPPSNWELLPPGDATLTRRVKAGGPTWTVQKMKGRKKFSLGVWAPADRIAKVRADLEVERSSESYGKRRAADAMRREKKQNEYVEDFRGAVLSFLNFEPEHAYLADELAEKVAAHATPIGSGTVARTKRIPIEQRAESAVIAWMRHATTAYDNMKIPRVKGKRREVRRMLAEQSRRILDRYRNRATNSSPQDVTNCPLREALKR